MRPEQESPILRREILHALKVHENSYAGGDSVYDGVSHRYFTGFVGPFEIGKTFFSDKAVEAEPELQLIDTVTTRAGKEGDPAGFITGMPLTQFRDNVNDGAFVNYSIIDGLDGYATFPEGFHAKYNIGPFLPSGIQQIERAGFAGHQFIYFVAEGALWRQAAETRRARMSSEAFSKRAYEGARSVLFAKRNSDKLIFVENTYNPEDLPETVRKVSQIALFNSKESLPQERALHLLDEMHATAMDLAVD